MFRHTLILCLIGFTMATEEAKLPVDVKEYFDIGKNLTLLTWDHAVNNLDALDKALKNDKHMIEADVVMKKKTAPLPPGEERSAEEPEEPPTIEDVVMGHSLDDQSTLTLKDFMAKVVEHTTGDDKKKKGVKLDFKSTEAAKLAMDKLLTENSEFKPEFLKFPLWINADIVEGPRGGKPGVVFEEAPVGKEKIINAIVWSLGWTTGDFKKDELGYTKEQIDDMIKIKNEYKVGKIVYPVRAMDAAKSKDQVLRLIDTEDMGGKGALTIWSAADDDEHVDIEALIDLIDEHEDKCFVDVPKTLEAKMIKMRNGASIATVSKVTFLVLGLFYALFY